jgi:acyl-CoA thioesterase
VGNGDLERALAVEPAGAGRWRGVASPDYESANGTFGGLTAALALGAIVRTADAPAARPAALTVDYLDRIAPGCELELRVERVGGGRSVGFWRCEVLDAASGSSLALASGVLAERRDTDGHVDIAAPAAPPPEGIEVVEAAPGPMGERTTVRPVVGYPPFDRPDTRSLAWVQETSGRSVDHLQLAYMADHRAPRSFSWSSGPRPSATLTMSIWFHATDDELAAVGDDHLLSEAFGTRGAQGTSEEHLRLWSRHGALLASSVQLCWYR